MMTSITPRRSHFAWLAVAVVAAGATVAALALRDNIATRKQEGVAVAFRTVELDENDH